MKVNESHLAFLNSSLTQSHSKPVNVFTELVLASCTSGLDEIVIWKQSMNC